MVDIQPCEKMTSIGIVQDGDPTLRRSAAAFDLPGDADTACAVIAKLQAALDLVGQAHTFAKAWASRPRRRHGCRRGPGQYR